MKRIKSVAILGPTGVGKSALGILISQKFNGEIVSVDSRQMYKEMNIGTAKPSDEELALIPHHMISRYSMNEEISVNDYIKDASEIIKDINKRGKLPVIVGGTGLYFDSLLHGIANLPSKNEKLRQRMEKIISKKRGILKLYNLLNRVDPTRAQKLSANDKVRIMRALEVYFITGIPMSSFEKIEKKPIINLDIIQLGLTMDRKLLYNAINKRVDKMVGMGLFDEIEELVKKVKFQKLLSTIGYSEVLSYFNGLISREECIELIKRNSRRYAKRQYTWLRKNKELNWIDVEDNLYIDEAVRFVAEFLGK